MAETELTLELRPARDGRYTLVNLQGTIATVAHPKEMRSLLKTSWWWSCGQRGKSGRVNTA